MGVLVVSNAMQIFCVLIFFINGVIPILLLSFPPLMIPRYIKGNQAGTKLVAHIMLQCKIFIRFLPLICRPLWWQLIAKTCCFVGNTIKKDPLQYYLLLEVTKRNFCYCFTLTFSHHKWQSSKSLSKNNNLFVGKRRGQPNSAFFLPFFDC